MARSSLGKRSRAVDESALVDLPVKRSRRLQSLAQLSFENDENQDPATPACEEADAEWLPRKEISSRSPLVSSKLNPRTPSTPRHRDALSQSPVTPRQFVKSAGKLFQRLTPQSPLSPSSQTVYHSARQLFSRGSDPGQLVGREEEKAQLENFLKRCSSSRPGGCLYVSGPPGTGKSAMVMNMTQKITAKSSVRRAYVNCMSIKSTKDLCMALARELKLGDEAVLAQEDMDSLQDVFLDSKNDTVYMVVLDEIDHILTLGLESLYRLFEWSLHKTSRLLLVGIANALDLTDRFLPRLKAKNLKPELLPIQPYSTGQIKNIISTRLKSLLPNDYNGPEYVPFIHPAAIELCSRKVSAQTGDLRKAFEICRRALELVEAETRTKHEDEAREKMLLQSPSRKPLGENMNSSSAPIAKQPRSATQIAVESLKALTAQTAPRVSISHLNKITAAAFSNGTTHRLKALNLQQRAALCSLVAIEKRNREARLQTGLSTPSKTQVMAPTQRTLFEAYCRLCKRDAVLHPLSSSEFREVLGSLETLGLTNAVEGKTGSLVVSLTPSRRGRKCAFSTADEKRVASCVSETEIKQVVDGSGADILQSILEGDALD